MRRFAIVAGCCIGLAAGVAALLWLPIDGRLDAPPDVRPRVEERDERAPRVRATEAGARDVADLPAGTGRIDGRVVDPRGVAGTRVTVAHAGPARDPAAAGAALLIRCGMAPPGSSAANERSFDAAADGSFTVADLAPGLYALSATATDGRRAACLVDLPEGAASAAAELRFPGGEHSLHGRVVRDDGHPFVGRVLLGPASEDFPWTTDVASVPWVAPDAEGRFRFDGVDAARVAVAAVVAGEVTVRSDPIEVPSDAEVLLRIPVSGPAWTGRVVRAADGAPVPDAEVVVRGVSGSRGVVREARVVRTAADGTFASAVAMPAFVSARAPGYALGFVYGTERNADPVIRLVPACTLEGRVVNAADETGVAGVRLLLHPMGERNDGRPVRVAISGPGGAFRYDDLPPGEVDAVVHDAAWVSVGLADADRHEYDPLRLAIEPDTPMRVELRVERAAAVRGRVLDPAGEPIAGARVRAQLMSWQVEGVNSAHWDVRADDEGRYFVPGLVPRGQHVLEVSTESAAPTVTRAFSVESGATLEMDIVLAPGREAWLRVVDASSGAPVPGARVRYRDRGPIPTDEDERITWTSDDAGSVRAKPIPAGDVTFEVEADAYIAPEERFVLAAGAEASQAAPLVVRLMRGASIEGIVRLPDGRPAEGAEVGVDRDPMMRGHIPLTMRARFADNAATTDADGRFRISGLAPGTTPLLVTLRREREFLTWTGDVEPGGAAVEIVLAATATIPRLRVRVEGPGGERVAKAQVTLGGGFGTHGNRLTDGEVAFEVDDGVGARPSLLVTEPADEAGTPLPFGAAHVVVAQFGDEPFVVRLGPEHVIAGRVIGPDGNGIARALVTAVQENGGRDGEHGRARTAEGGSFRIGRLGAGTYRLQIDGPAELARASATEVAVDGPPVTLRLRGPVAVVVRVEDEDGQPVEGAHVSAELDGGDVFDSPDATTGADGTARLEGLDPEAVYSVGVYAEREDLHGLHRDEWRPAPTTFVLERALEIRGTVRDATGRAVPNARVHLRRDHYALTAATADAGGNFRISRLRPGDSTLLAAAPARTVESDEDATGELVDPAAFTWTEVQAGDVDVVLVLDR